MLVACLAGTACTDAGPHASDGTPDARTGPVPGEWPLHGRTHAEQRFSPLDAIHRGNVSELGLAWYFDSEDTRGLEATPLFVGGVLYFTASWDVVYAVDARTGALRWRYDPEVPREIAWKLCCGPVNRGAAYADGRIYVGTLDGRLIALDARTGALVWERLTVDPSGAYSITGAPRVFDGKVVIGNGGAEFGVRGYVGAYDAATGAPLWRWYTVPGNPADGFENDAMATAAATWTGEWWRHGGGGTVWDGMSYDPDLGLLYIGVGNGSPHNRRIRSPEGGDNLFLASIVALDAATGEYRWHYQEVPAETWDYTATQQIVLCEIEWQGRLRRVLLHAPKNGFFYVIDRETGELLSAEPFVTVNWASRVDLATGRPVENPGADYTVNEAFVRPAPTGAHNWHAMAYDPRSQRVYIPVQDFPVGLQGIDPDEYVYEARHFNLGYRPVTPVGDRYLVKALVREIPKGYLLAWDPIAGREVWRARRRTVFNGGALASAGDLVFQGTLGERFQALDSETGHVLWDFPAQNGIVGAPITYLLDGEQYVAVLAGHGGLLSNGLGIERPRPRPNGRLLVFRRGGRAQLPERPDPAFEPLPARMDIQDAELEQGYQLYNRYCLRCHGNAAVADGSLPDLRLLPPSAHEHFVSVVLEGGAAGSEMPRFDDVLDAEQARWIHAYVIGRAYEDAAIRNSPGWWRWTRETLATGLAKTIDVFVDELK